MSDQANPAEIEDVLSSIRRLVAGGGRHGESPRDEIGRAAEPAPDPEGDSALVLTPSLRVGAFGEDAPERHRAWEEDAAADSAGAAAEGDDADWDGTVSGAWRDAEAAFEDAGNARPVPAEDATAGAGSHIPEATREGSADMVGAAPPAEGSDDDGPEGRAVASTATDPVPNESGTSDDDPVETGEREPEFASDGPALEFEHRKSPFLSETLMAKRSVERVVRRPVDEAPRTGFGFGSTRRDDPVRHVPLSDRGHAPRVVDTPRAGGVDRGEAIRSTDVETAEPAETETKDTFPPEKPGVEPSDSSATAGGASGFPPVHRTGAPDAGGIGSVGEDGTALQAGTVSAETAERDTTAIDAGEGNRAAGKPIFAGDDSASEGEGGDMSARACAPVGDTLTHEIAAEADAPVALRSAEASAGPEPSGSQGESGPDREGAARPPREPHGEEDLPESAASDVAVQDETVLVSVMRETATDPLASATEPALAASEHGAPEHGATEQITELEREFAGVATGEIEGNMGTDAAAVAPTADFLPDDELAPAAPRSGEAAASEAGPGLAAAHDGPATDRLNVFGAELVSLDEEALRAIVADVVHGELQGALGERVSHNIRQLVRREIARALESRGLA